MAQQHVRSTAMVSHGQPRSATVRHGQPPFCHVLEVAAPPFSRLLWRDVASSGAGFWLLTMASWRRFLHVKIAEMGHKIAFLAHPTLRLSSYPMYRACQLILPNTKVTKKCYFFVYCLCLKTRKHFE